MKMCFTRGLLLLQEHSSVLLWKQELMAFWILQEDHFVTQVKVFSMPLSDSFSPCKVLRYPNYETLLAQQYTTLQTSIEQFLSYQIWKFHLTTGKVFTLASLKGTYKESCQASSYRLLMTDTINLNLVMYLCQLLHASQQVVKHGNNIHCSTLELASVSIPLFQCWNLITLSSKSNAECINLVSAITVIFLLEFYHKEKGLCYTYSTIQRVFRWWWIILWLSSLLEWGCNYLYSANFSSVSSGPRLIRKHGIQYFLVVGWKIMSIHCWRTTLTSFVCKCVKAIYSTT